MYIIQFKFKSILYDGVPIEATGRGYLRSAGMAGWEYTTIRSEAYEINLKLANKLAKFLKVDDDTVSNIQVKEVVRV